MNCSGAAGVESRLMGMDNACGASSCNDTGMLFEKADCFRMIGWDKRDSIKAMLSTHICLL